MLARYQRIPLLAALCTMVLPLAADAIRDNNVTSTDTTATHGALPHTSTATLVALRVKIETVQEMAAAGEITTPQADSAIRRYLADARDAAGNAVSLEELLAVHGTLAAPTTQLTQLQMLAGFVTAVNIAWVAAGVLTLVGIVFLFGFFIRVGPAFWEFVLYVASSVFLYAAWKASPGVAEYLGFTGAAALAGAIGFTWFLHMKTWATERTRMTTFFATVALLEATFALLLHNSAIGFLAVMALMGALGFSVAVIPFGFAVGWEEKNLVPRATNASFAILVGFVLLKLYGQQTPLAVFEAGAYFMGAFVGYLGLLIMASKWYDRTMYPLMQVTMIAAGAGAIVVGSILHIGELQKIGGTFLALWVMEKLAEVPVQSKEDVAMLCLVTAALLTSAGFIVKLNLPTFAPYVLGL